jgi:hypothetical protein
MRSKVRVVGAMSREYFVHDFDVHGRRQIERKNVILQQPRGLSLESFPTESFTLQALLTLPPLTEKDTLEKRGWASAKTLHGFSRTCTVEQLFLHLYAKTGIQYPRVGFGESFKRGGEAWLMLVG